MEFKTPLFLIAIPLILGLMWWMNRRKTQATVTFSSTDIVKDLPRTWKLRFGFIPFMLRLIAVLLICFALAGPRKILETSKILSDGIDILLVLDCSGSMAAEDFKIEGKRMSRFEILKRVVGEFIEARPNDQLGIIGFAGKAYTICPLTTDRNWLLANLERMRLGLIEDGTAIGSGIASGISRFKNSAAKSKIIIVLTDGVNNAGSIDPLTAAKTAAALGIKVYTIGAGAKGYAPYPVRDMFGRTFYQNIPTDIDEVGLTKIAELTQGKYFRATDTESLRDIYKTIDQFEKTKIEQVGYKQYQELFGYFVIAALLLLAIEILLINTLFLRIP